MRYRWFDKEEEEIPQKKKPRVARGELTGIFISVVIFLYGMSQRDIPAIFVAVAFLMHEVRPIVMLLGDPAGSFFSNLLQGFSIVLFLGAFFMIFF